jgi:tRNA (guanine-N7-)-methyltransferase
MKPENQGENSSSHQTPGGEDKPPSLSPESLIFKPPSYFERLDLSQIFPRVQPLEVELGAGDGSFISAYAAAHPERNFIAVERLLGRLRKVDKKGRRARLTNLRALRIEASYCVEYLLPLRSVQALHIYFPDPWPKRRHKPRRLINNAFTEAAARALQPRGTVYLRTDDPDYFAQMQRVFGENSAFEPAEIPPELTAFLTDFQREFQSRGIASFQAAFRKIALPK